MQSSKPYQPFVILGTARIGSTLLWSYLNSHPDILCMRGVYGSTNKINFGKYYNDLPEECSSKDLIKKRNERPIEFLNDHIFKEYPRSYKAVGFKYFYDHDRHLQNKSELVDYFSANKAIRFIHLIRENLLATLFSYKRALAQKLWTSACPEYKTEIGVSECEDYFRFISTQQSKFRQLFGDRSLQISFETFTAQQNITLSEIQMFLGVEPKLLTSEISKNAETQLVDSITNFIELKQHFQGSIYAGYFSE